MLIRETDTQGHQGKAEAETGVAQDQASLAPEAGRSQTVPCDDNQETDHQELRLHFGNKWRAQVCPQLHVSWPSWSAVSHLGDSDEQTLSPGHSSSLMNPLLMEVTLRTQSSLHVPALEAQAGAATVLRSGLGRRRKEPVHTVAEFFNMNHPAEIRQGSISCAPGPIGLQNRSSVLKPKMKRSSSLSAEPPVRSLSGEVGA